MDKTAKEFRERVTQRFIDLLENKELNWIKEWSSGSIKQPISGINGRRYKGINIFNLYITMLENGWTDPRWFTFNKLGMLNRNDGEDGHPMVKKGEHGTKVEFWFLFDSRAENGQKSVMTIQDARKLVNSGMREWKDFKWKCRIHTVFNAHQIEGLKLQDPEERKRNMDVTVDQVVNDISKSMGVPINYDEGDRCYYRPSEDAIYLPKPEYFKTSYAFNSTALHELGHATGAECRLNRGLMNVFGTEEYAFEELIAELTSCMFSAEIAEPHDDDNEYWEHHLKNHAAYVQNWIRQLKKDSTALERAIKQAEMATDFLEMHAGIIKPEEYYRKHATENMNTVMVDSQNNLIPEQPEENIQEIVIDKRSRKIR